MAARSQRWVCATLLVLASLAHAAIVAGGSSPGAGGYTAVLRASLLKPNENTMQYSRMLNLTGLLRLSVDASLMAYRFDHVKQRDTPIAAPTVIVKFNSDRTLTKVAFNATVCQVRTRAFPTGWSGAEGDWLLGWLADASRMPCVSEEGASATCYNASATAGRRASYSGSFDAGTRQPLEVNRTTSLLWEPGTATPLAWQSQSFRVVTFDATAPNASLFDIPPVCSHAMAKAWALDDDAPPDLATVDGMLKCLEQSLPDPADLASLAVDVGKCLFVEEDPEEISSCVVAAVDAISDVASTIARTARCYRRHHPTEPPAPSGVAPAPPGQSCDGNGGGCVCSKHELPGPCFCMCTGPASSQTICAGSCTCCGNPMKNMWAPCESCSPA